MNGMNVVDAAQLRSTKNAISNYRTKPTSSALSALQLSRNSVYSRRLGQDWWELGSTKRHLFHEFRAKVS